MSKEEHKNKNNKICNYYTTDFVYKTKTKSINIENTLFGKNTILNKDQILQFPKNNIKFNNVSFSTTPLIWNNQTRIRSKN
jgi:hypothetical protein